MTKFKNLLLYPFKLVYNFFDAVKRPESSRYIVNDARVSKEQLLAYIADPNVIVEQLTIEFNNENKSSNAPNMNGFVISADYLIAMANKSDEMDATVTATFENCGNLGGKTVTISVG